MINSFYILKHSIIPIDKKVIFKRFISSCKKNPNHLIPEILFLLEALIGALKISILDLLKKGKISLYLKKSFTEINHRKIISLQQIILTSFYPMPLTRIVFKFKIYKNKLLKRTR